MGGSQPKVTLSPQLSVEALEITTHANWSAAGYAQPPFDDNFDREVAMSDGSSLLGLFSAPAMVRSFEVVSEALRIDSGPVTPFATESRITLDLKTFRLRDYSGEGVGGSLPILVHAPFAGHDSVIADFHRRQSLMSCLKRYAAGPLYLTDWKSADHDTQNFGIDEYLAELAIALDEIGGCAHLVGLCQGGWACAMLAARFPDRVGSLVLAGAPLDLHAGDGYIKRTLDLVPQSYFDGLVAFGGGRLRGAFMLQAFKAMHPFKNYVERYIHLYEHVEEPDLRERLERFAGWFEHPIDLPGPWYLQVVQELFRENRLCAGTFVGLGRILSLSDIHCPVFLLAGHDDDITPPAQVHDAASRFGTAGERIEQRTVAGGHVGLFMSHRTVGDIWPEIAAWIRQQDVKAA